MDAFFNFPKIAGILVNKLAGWVTAAVKLLPNLAVALFVLIIIWIISIPIGRSAQKLVGRFSMHLQLAKLSGRIARLAVMAIGIILALQVLNLDKAVASLLAGVGIIGFAITFASQDIASNFIAGLFLTFSQPFKIGDLIRSKDFLGYVEEINMRSTVGQSLESEQVILPNKDILANPILNYTVGGQNLISLSGSIPCKNNLASAEGAATKAVESLKLRSPERPVEFFYKEFSGNVINFTIRFWTSAEPKRFREAHNEAIKAIKEAFDEQEINMISD